MISVTFPPLHPGQTLVRDSRARFKVLVAGRRWGKTRLGILLCLQTAFQGGRSWWVGPTFPVAEIAWRMLRALVRPIPGTVVREVDRRVILPQGGEVTVKSAENPDSLRGEGLHGVVLDEAALMRPEAWGEALRPALADHRGWALFISTPKGYNWFHELYRHAEMTAGWAAWRFPSWENSFLMPSEIENMRRTMTAARFRQEVGAEFVSFEGQLFAPDVIAACWDGARGFEPAWSYCMRCKVRHEGVLHGTCIECAGRIVPRDYVTRYDLARKKDWVVGITVDATEEPAQIVAFERFQKQPWPVVVRRVEVRAALYAGDVGIDGTGVGDAVLGFFESASPQAVLFSPKSKTDMVMALQMLLERGGLKGPQTGGGIEALWEELLAYQWDEKDLTQDCVMALAMVARAVETGGARLVGYTL